MQADALGTIHRVAFIVIPLLWVLTTLPVIAMALIDPRRRSFWFTTGLFASNRDGEALLRAARILSGIVVAICLIWDVFWVSAGIGRASCRARVCQYV